jgi:hypothetical protein
MTVASMHPPGTQFVRMALCLARAGESGTQGALAICEREYGAGSALATVLRSAVAAGSTTDSGWASQLAEMRVLGQEFVTALRPSTIIGKLTGIRRIPLQVKVPRATSGSSVNWVGQRSPAALSSLALDLIELPTLQVSGLISTTRELAAMSTPRAEGLVRADLLAATSAFLDAALIDPTAAGASGVSPASVTYGAASIAATGTTAAAMVDDIRNLVRLVLDQGCDMTAPYFIMHPRVAIAMALVDTPSPFPNLGAHGGEIAGIPCLTSGSVPYRLTGDSPHAYTSSIFLIDAAELLLGDEGTPTVELSEHATLQMDTSPSSPPVAGTVMVSLWQHGLVCWRVVLPTNFTMRRPKAVGVLTGVPY